MADKVAAYAHTFQSAAAANGNGTAMAVGGLSGVGVQVEGITTATVTFYGTIDGSTWYAVEALNRNDGSKATTTTADGLFVVPTAGMDQLRCAISGYSAGSITVTGKGITNPDAVGLGDVTAAGTVTANQGTAAAALAGWPAKDDGPAWTPSYQHTASANASAGADATAAPTSSQKIVIDDVIVSVGSALTVTFEEETSGTDIYVFYMPANSTIQVTPRGKVKLPVANNKLRIKTSGAGNVACTVVYHSEA